MGKIEGTFAGYESMMIAAALRGGYVVRHVHPPGQFASDIAAFSTLEEACSWLKRNMVNRPAGK